jgi:hypothetical protein
MSSSFFALLPLSSLFSSLSSSRQPENGLPALNSRSLAAGSCATVGLWALAARPDLLTAGHRKRVLHKLNSLISGTATTPDEVVEEEVTDTEWFFLISMTQSFLNGSSLPGQELFTGQLNWIASGLSSVCHASARVRPTP